MPPSKKFTFQAEIAIIDINPYVLLPNEILNGLFEQAGKNTSPIPIHGTMDGAPFIQHLVKFRGKWRLYINTPMRKATLTKVGDITTFVISYDSGSRETPMHPKLNEALKKNEAARKIYEDLAPSLQKEIRRYIHQLKTEESKERNVDNAIQFLLGKKRFIGRDKP